MELIRLQSYRANYESIFINIMYVIHINSLMYLLLILFYFFILPNKAKSSCIHQGYENHVDLSTISLIRVSHLLQGRLASVPAGTSALLAFKYISLSHDGHTSSLRQQQRHRMSLVVAEMPLNSFASGVVHLCVPFGTSFLLELCRVTRRALVVS